MGMSRRNHRNIADVHITACVSHYCSSLLSKMATIAAPSSARWQPSQLPPRQDGNHRSSLLGKKATIAAPSSARRQPSQLPPRQEGNHRSFLLGKKATIAAPSSARRKPSQLPPQREGNHRSFLRKVTHAHDLPVVLQCS